MVMGLPHSSQSISVGDRPGLGHRLPPGNPAADDTTAAISRAFSFPSFNAGSNASTCLQFLALSFFTCLGCPAFGKPAATQERATLAVARRIIGLPHFSHLIGVGTFVLGGMRLAVLVEVDDRVAERLAVFVLDRVSGAAQEFAEAALAFDHLAAALGAFVLADFSCIFGLPC